MKLKKTIITTCSILAISIGAYMYADSKIAVSEIDALPVQYNSLEELEISSEITISGRPVSSENHVVRDNEGFTQEAYTITDFKIDQIYNGSSLNIKEGSIIKVAEPLYIIDNGLKPGKTQFAINGYRKMEKEQKYLLVLRADNIHPDLYVIVGTNDGVYSLTPNTEMKSNSPASVGKFRDELFKKYNIEY